MKKIIVGSTLLVLITTNSACTDSKTSALDMMSDASTNYSNIVATSYADSLSTAQDMDAALNTSPDRHGASPL